MDNLCRCADTSQPREPHPHHVGSQGEWTGSSKTLAYCDRCWVSKRGIELCPIHAAAPTLLKALELLADGVSSPGYPNTVTHVPAPWALTAARDAIAQAKGTSK